MPPAQKASAATQVPPAESVQLLNIKRGVWDFWMIRQAGFDPKRQWDDALAAFQLFCRFAMEVYALEPWMLLLYILSKLWIGVETAVLLHSSSRLLQIIEVGSKGDVDSSAIFEAIICRLLCLAFANGLRPWTHASPILKGRVLRHYDIFIMKARLKIDLPTSQELSSRALVSSAGAWTAFDIIVTFFTNILNSASQLAVIAHTSRASGSPFFALLCVARPLFIFVSSRSIWSQSLFTYSYNPHYRRMKALESLTEDQYKEDHISGNLSDYIISEYQKARTQLGDACTDDFFQQYEKHVSPFYEILRSLLGELPMVYCALNVVYNPTISSLASLALLQNSSNTLRDTFLSILDTAGNFQRQYNTLKNLYALSEVENILAEGELPYPLPDKDPNTGMGFDLQDVTFNYPGTTKSALNNISISIKPNQLVVIVGANGSGKSTLIKLLSRLYGASSGTLLVDGTPVEQFRASELHQAMAMLTQNHALYPLSLSENIAIGDPASGADKEKIKTAAEEGGSFEFMSKLQNGMDTVLNRKDGLWSVNLPKDPEHPLLKQMQNVQKIQDLSGGERQRIVASRMFMHLNSNKVKFVALDEPSSALDPEAERKLFERLIARRAGKTMLFVTHRFGHLTKHADLIICLKDGVVEESGTHDELMNLHGEYAKLFNDQAAAFS